MILFCTCHHKFQDERYGPQRRVHNKTAKSAPATYRCTVCCKERPKDEPKK